MGTGCACLFVGAGAFGRNQLSFARESRLLLQFVSTVREALDVVVGVGFCGRKSACTVSGWRRTGEQQRAFHLPYALRLNAFFMPAMVSAKRTCWVAMVVRGSVCGWCVWVDETQGVCVLARAEQLGGRAAMRQGRTNRDGQKELSSAESWSEIEGFELRSEPRSWTRPGEVVKGWRRCWRRARRGLGRRGNGRKRGCPPQSCACAVCSLLCAHVRP